MFRSERKKRDKRGGSVYVYCQDGKSPANGIGFEWRRHRDIINHRYQITSTIQYAMLQLTCMHYISFSLSFFVYGTYVYLSCLQDAVRFFIKRRKGIFLYFCTNRSFCSGILISCTTDMVEFSMFRKFNWCFFGRLDLTVHQPCYSAYHHCYGGSATRDAHSHIAASEILSRQHQSQQKKNLHLWPSICVIRSRFYFLT